MTNSVSGVKGVAETSYRHGNVSLTLGNFGIIFQANVLLKSSVSLAAKTGYSWSVGSALTKAGYNAFVFPFANAQNYIQVSIGYDSGGTAYINAFNTYTSALTTAIFANVVWIKSTVS